MRSDQDSEGLIPGKLERETTRFDMNVGSALIYVVHSITAVTSTLASHKMTWTRHTYDMSWNEAETICRLNGGHLLSVDSEEKQTVFNEYMDTIWSDYAGKHTWFGLHVSADTGLFSWCDCTVADLTQFSYWRSGEMNTNDKCVMFHDGPLEWESRKCNRDEPFVCENTQDDVCSYRLENGPPEAKSTSFTDVLETSQNETHCQELCSNVTSCWAVEFSESVSDENCRLMFTSNPFLFSVQTPDVGANFSVKECYSGEVQTTDNSGLSKSTRHDLDNKTPINVCDFTTTTTTTTTTPTSLTTESTTQQPTPSTTTSTATTVGTPQTTAMVPAVTAQETTISATSMQTTQQTSTTAQQTTTKATTTAQQTTIATTAQQTTTVTMPTAIATTDEASTSKQPQPSTTKATVTTTTELSAATCQCMCTDIKPLVTLTTEEAVEKIISELTVPKEALSSSIRKKTSVSDRRTSASSIGWVGITFLVLVFGFLVMLDAVDLLNFVWKKFKRP